MSITVATIVKAITAISVAVMASGCSQINDGYKVWTTNKTGPGYGQVYQSPTFHKIEDCNAVLPHFRKQAVPGEYFFCADTEKTHINWKFWE